MRAYGDEWLFNRKGPDFDLEDTTRFSGVTLGLHRCWDRIWLPGIPRPSIMGKEGVSILAFWKLTQGWLSNNILLTICMQLQVPCFMSAALNATGTPLTSGGLTVWAKPKVPGGHYRKSLAMSQTHCYFWALVFGCRTSGSTFFFFVWICHHSSLLWRDLCFWKRLRGFQQLMSHLHNSVSLLSLSSSTYLLKLWGSVISCCHYF